MKKYINNKAFTIIELLVSITIFSIIMVSVINLYIVSTKITYKSDINRIMHENIKSVVTEITEDLLKNGISGVSKDLTDLDCQKSGNGKVLSGDKVCIGDNKYFLSQKSGEDLIRVEGNSCDDFKNPCFIVKNGEKITNSLVNVEDLKFYLTDNGVKKLTISIILGPSLKSGVKPEFIEKTKINFQTTLSDKINYNLEKKDETK